MTLAALPLWVPLAASLALVVAVMQASPKVGAVLLIVLAFGALAVMEGRK